MNAILSRDGSSPDRAIIVQTVAEEYAWVARHCPGYSLGLQRLKRHDDAHLDVLTLMSESDDVRDIYFDVSELFKDR